MTSLATALDEYLDMRQALGLRLRVPAGLLRGFVAVLDAEGLEVITRDAAVQWAMAPRHAQPATWAWRLGIVRRFAHWRQVTDPRTEVPPAGLLPHRFRRPRPHLYSDEEIRALLTAARTLPSPRGLRGLTYVTLFGLLAVTGLRVSEALQLDDTDVALDRDHLTIRRTKFGKSRLVPVHRSWITNSYSSARPPLERIGADVTCGGVIHARCKSRPCGIGRRATRRARAWRRWPPRWASRRGACGDGCSRRRPARGSSRCTWRSRPRRRRRR